MRKIKVGIWMAVVLLVGCLAVMTHFSFTDHYNQIEYREKLVVPYLPKELKELCEGQYNMLKDSPIIITAKATGEYQYVFGNLWQKVVVEEVIRGEDKIDSGDTVKIVGTGKVGGKIKSGEYKGLTYVDTSFLNYMKKDKEYLIFLNNRVHAGYEHDKVYRVNKDAVTLQYINITDDSGGICDVRDTDGPSEMLYSCFKDYEFATNSKEVLKSLEKIKRQFIDFL